MNPYSIVDEFEKTIAEYSGAEYGVAVESCTAAIFLSLKYNSLYSRELRKYVLIPSRTYPSVPCQIIHAGYTPMFRQIKWEGVYQLHPHKIFDSALRFKRNMYIAESLYCLSFHFKKHLPIGRGGMILTDNKDVYHWFKKARFDGRSECPLNQDKIDMIGWNCYMTPEQAARGLVLFDFIKDKNLKDLKVKDQNYPDLSKIKRYGEYY